MCNQQFLKRERKEEGAKLILKKIRFDDVKKRKKERKKKKKKEKKRE